MNLFIFSIFVIETFFQHLATLDLKIDSDTLNKWKKQYPDQTIVPAELDVTKRADVDSVFCKVKDQMGGLDIVINCSGILNEQDPDATIQINLVGTIYTTLASIELMGKQNGGEGGTVVNVASVLGLEPSPPFAVYSASKHGVVGLARSFSNEFHYNKTGMRFITICPGITETSLVVNIEATFDYAQEEADLFSKAKTQTPDICGKNIVKAIQNGKHGSIWICDLGTLREAQMPQHWDLTF